MKRKYKRARRRYRHRSFNASRFAPFIKLGAVILGVLAFAALIIFVALPKLLPLIGIDYRAPFSPTPTPVPTAKPTPTPHPIETASASEMQTEVLMPSGENYVYFGDPYAYEGTIIFTTGKMVDSTARMCGMYFYDPQTQESTAAGAELENDFYYSPVFNDQYLVYMDAKLEGGGKILLLPMDGSSTTPTVVKEVYTGLVRLSLDGQYLAWTERTGTRMDKLFVCDLTTLETTTVQMFSNTAYGQSLPSLDNGLLVWADTDGEESENPTSAIHSIRITASSINTYLPGTYVHDPKGNALYFAWLDGNHGPDTKLYYSKSSSSPVEVDEGVVDFGLGSSFIAYGKDEAIYVYLFDKKKQYRLTEDWELGQFLGVSDDKVFWMDVTSRERDILKFASIE